MIGLLEGGVSMSNEFSSHGIAITPFGLRALIGGGLAIAIGLLLLAFDPSPSDRVAGVLLGLGVFFVVFGLVAPPASHN
jgi:hypothetical protein